MFTDKKSRRFGIVSLLMLFLLAGSAAATVPVNDDCANATVIGDGSYWSATTTATNDGSAGCGDSGTAADVDGDGDADIEDASIIAANWLCGYTP